RLCGFSSVFQNDFGQCEIAGVGEAQAEMSRSQAVCVFARYAMKKNRRPAAGLPRHLDIPPAHAFAPAGAQSLHRGLFGCKAGGVALCGVAMTFTVGDLGGGKNAIEENAAVPAGNIPNPADFLPVHTQPYNHVTSFSQSHPVVSTAIRNSGLYRNVILAPSRRSQEMI